MADPILPGPIEIDEALATETAHKLEVRAFKTPRFSEPADVTGKTASVWIASPSSGGSPKEYPVTWTNPALGEGHIILGASDFTEPGVVDAQLHLEGALKQRYLLEFVQNLATAPANP